MREYAFVSAVRPIHEGEGDTIFEGSVGFGFDRKPGARRGVLRHQPETPHSLSVRASSCSSAAGRVYGVPSCYPIVLMRHLHGFLAICWSSQPLTHACAPFKRRKQNWVLWLVGEWGMN